MKAVLELLIPVLMMVESGNNVDEVGDNGKAVGCLQIHKIMVDDVNRIADFMYVPKGWICSKYSYDDRYSRIQSTQMCEIYLNYYYDKYVNWYKEHGTSEHPHPMDVVEICARLWNGGYEGLKRNPKATNKYWSKVLRLL